MAANCSIRHIFYAPNMCLLAKRFGVRSMATMTSGNHISLASVVGVWSHDPSFPLPGNIGVDMNALESAGGSNSTSPKTVVSPPYQSLASALLDLEDEGMRKNRILNLFVGENLEDADDSIEKVTSYLNDNNTVECKIQTCPESLIKGFKSLFAELPIENAGLFTVITISQRTENDMTSWSEEVETEREALTGIFIDNAKEICLKIKKNGYWADFIEPSSGHAFYSSHRNETLFDTDDRLNQLGFQVEDLGCCKVLMHKEWNSNVFVGMIFTNAPVESHFLETL